MQSHHQTPLNSYNSLSSPAVKFPSKLSQQNKAQTNLIEAIAAQILPLLDVTHNLKCTAYKFVNLPTGNIKSKVISCQASLLTSLQSVAYDLKRVESILSQSLWMKVSSSGFNGNKVYFKKNKQYTEYDREIQNSNGQEEIDQQGVDSQGKITFSNDTFRGPGFSKKSQSKIQNINRNQYCTYAASQIGGYESGSRLQIPSIPLIKSQAKGLTNQTIHNRNITQNSQINIHIKEEKSKAHQLRQLYAGQGDPSSSDVGLLGRPKFERNSNLKSRSKSRLRFQGEKKEKKYNVNNLHKVASIEHIGYGSRNDDDDLKTKIQKSMEFEPEKTHVNINSSRESEMKKSRRALDWEELYMEDLLLEEKNEEFLRKIKREREQFIRFINKKNERCLNKINQLKTMKDIDHKSVNRFQQTKTKIKTRTEKIFSKGQFDTQTEALIGSIPHLNLRYNNLSEKGGVY